MEAPQDEEGEPEDVQAQRVNRTALWMSRMRLAKVGVEGQLGLPASSQFACDEGGGPFLVPRGVAAGGRDRSRSLLRARRAGSGAASASSFPPGYSHKQWTEAADAKEEDTGPTHGGNAGGGPGRLATFRSDNQRRRLRTEDLFDWQDFTLLREPP